MQKYLRKRNIRNVLSLVNVNQKNIAIFDVFCNL